MPHKRYVKYSHLHEDERDTVVALVIVVATLLCIAVWAGIIYAAVALIF